MGLYHSRWYAGTFEQIWIQQSLWQEQADYNAKQAQIDREYQERMSNTAYQRAVKDLLLAGLNPILAVGNMGASTPVGAMASSGLASAIKANAYAESESYGSSASRSYARSGSHGESHATSSSKSEGSSWNAGKSHSESSQGSHSESHGGSQSSSSNSSHDRSSTNSNSKTETQLKSLVNAVTGLMSGKK